jgi:hypothetical protein
MVIDRDEFARAFEHFQRLVVAKSGRRFESFDEGLIAVWESYKPRLRSHALGLLDVGEWAATTIGTGEILKRTISAIEIQSALGNLTNNLVFWQNRFGHANRDHRVLLEATRNPNLATKLERLLYGLFAGGEDEAAIFDALSELTGRKYPLSAYLYFLKDVDRFMPIQPTGFDRVFGVLGIDLVTLRQCGWANYSAFNQTLEALRGRVAEVANIANVRLIDAHSFCWTFATLLKAESEGLLEGGGRTNREGRLLGARETSIIAMRMSVEQTVGQSKGQVVSRTVKNKDLFMTRAELERHIERLLDVQENRCALTGIPLQFHSAYADKALRPSLDRIDSSGHYELGNLQVVCQFVNFWKGSASDTEFRRLLLLVQQTAQGQQ